MLAIHGLSGLGSQHRARPFEALWGVHGDALILNGKQLYAVTVLDEPEHLNAFGTLNWSLLEAPEQVESAVCEAVKAPVGDAVKPVKDRLVDRGAR